MIASVSVTLKRPDASSHEFGFVTLNCSVDEAFALLTMPALDGLVVSLVPEYAVSPVQSEEPKE